MLRVAVSRAFPIDVALLLVFAGTHLLVLVLSPRPSGALWWWPLLLSVPAMSLLLVRRHLPWTGLLVMLVVTIVLSYLQIPIGVLNLAILVGVYSVCLRADLAGSVAAAAAAMVWPLTRLPFQPVDEGVFTIVGSVVNLVMVVGWGRAMHVKRQRAEQLEQTVMLLDQARDQLAAEAATVERARIAREFHDIVSHNLSVVALRAGVARRLVDRNPEHARETLGELERTSRSALEEMRHLLSALRQEHCHAGTAVSVPDEPDPGRHPAPGLCRVDALVESVRDTGVVWRLERRGTVRELGPSVEVTAYRIVQEAVTNVLKHAATGYARVLLDYGRSALHIEVTNHATNPETPAEMEKPQVDVSHEEGSSVPGHGLIGLRERVSLLGGALTAHPVANGFHLSAVLPCPEISDLA
ncbi:signal transduction histidine kinase [Halopolyspora algeriensis]|uniref:histidine kinase n=1 Tax=Halopolyspora algeriensis TaxID=1500506 RepID=A0A368VWP2_9ACTN|nr:histidine kinase [Halopolyspora algeriensis]RCW43943.1 signal transduction histidine kinase [Halopolyspora algeriensis]TQM53554.1 signal transduction histidine kinase [Halopolyspora algeriensis]